MEEGQFWGLAQDEKLESISVRWPILKDDLTNSFMEKQYSMKGISLGNFTKLTLCESGKVLIGKKECP